MKKILMLKFVIFFSCTLNAQLAFQENIVIDYKSSLKFPTSVASADLNNDGLLDIIVSSANDNKISWYKNLNGKDYSTQMIISSDANLAQSVSAIDLDGDGDIDILSASAGDNKIAWYENLDGLGTFSNQIIISLEATFARDAIADDIDGDGDLDIVSASGGESKITWFENLDGNGNFGEGINISSNANFVETLLLRDIDGDNDLDLVAGLRLKSLQWYENLDGQGSFSNEKIIDSDFKFGGALDVNDLDGDGDFDIIASTYESTAKLVWYENLDGNGNYSNLRYIGSVKAGLSICSGDFDGDGDIDLLSGALSGAMKWFENSDGDAQFIFRDNLTNDGSAYSCIAEDFNNDGHLDILAVLGDAASIIWFDNKDGSGDFGFQKIIDKNVIGGPYKLFAGDIDGDNDLDLASVSSLDKVAWYENLNGYGKFGPQKVITYSPYEHSAQGINQMEFGDLDSDGDLDLLTSQTGFSRDGELFWVENIDGKGTFTTSHIIETLPRLHDRIIKIGDMDGDDDEDIVAFDVRNKVLMWFENVDSKGNFVIKQQINIGFHMDELIVIDHDNDGDLDVISYINGSWITLNENIDGLGNLSEYTQLQTNEGLISRIYNSDLNGDEFQDIITVNTSRDVYWFESLGGNLGFKDPVHISTAKSSHFPQLGFDDLDRDGDNDLVVSYSDGNGVVWYENLDGLGNFGVDQFVSNQSDSPLSLTTADINGDSSIDIIVGSIWDSKIAWYENKEVNKNDIHGSIRLDIDNDGCDSEDLAMSNIMIVAKGETDNYATLSQNNGFYQIFTNEGNFNLTSSSEFPAFFNLSPEVYDIQFSDIGNTAISDFCLTPNQSIADLDVTILPLTQARPGFNSRYQIVFNNKGTIPQSGTILFSYDESKLEFLSADDHVVNGTNNSISFNFYNLNVYESRKIELSFNIKAPPITNINEILKFEALIQTTSDDLTIDDNFFNFNQTVIGSYDPNDIIVLQGENIFIDEIDNFLHYIIRFQNTGTADAINVNITNLLDEKLNWSSLQIVDASHKNRLEIKNGNNLQFIFDNIFLPASSQDEEGSNGYIAYKIKPNTGVALGDIFYNNADIYFDFNPAINTNTVSTEVINTLGNSNFDLTTLMIYPNPTSEVLNIKASQDTFNFTIYNIFGQIAIPSIKSQNIDVKNLSSGLYLLKIEGDDGYSKYFRFVKK